MAAADLVTQMARWSSLSKEQEKKGRWKWGNKEESTYVPPICGSKVLLHSILRIINDCDQTNGGLYISQCSNISSRLPLPWKLTFCLNHVNNRKPI
jgi:hypothetical protein